MTQPELTLYHFPGACSQVAVCALEQAGLDYELKLVNLRSGEQTGTDYMTISPMGKIPVMAIDGKPLTENAAILTFIHALRPEAGIFPANPSPLMQAEIVGGMAFVGGSLHPQVRGLANPARLTAGDEDGVRTRSTDLLKKSLGYAERRFAERGWWLGEESIVDVYVNWALSVARRSGFDMSKLPTLTSLPSRLEARPAFVRMQAEEAESSKTLGL